jgi:transposase-like protein
MSRRSRRNHGPAFKAKVTPICDQGEKALAKLTQLYDVHTTQIAACKAQLPAGATGVFGAGSPGQPSGGGVDLKTLHAKIVELTLEIDFLPAALGKAGVPSAKR